VDIVIHLLLVMCSICVFLKNIIIANYDNINITIKHKNQNQHRTIIPLSSSFSLSLDFFRLLNLIFLTNLIHIFYIMSNIKLSCFNKLNEYKVFKDVDLKVGYLHCCSIDVYWPSSNTGVCSVCSRCVIYIHKL
jgi:hypothetical protein